LPVGNMDCVPLAIHADLRHTIDVFDAFQTTGRFRANDLWARSTRRMGTSDRDFPKRYLSG